MQLSDHEPVLEFLLQSWLPDCWITGSGTILSWRIPELRRLEVHTVDRCYLGNAPGPKRASSNLLMGRQRSTSILRPSHCCSGTRRLATTNKSSAFPLNGFIQDRIVLHPARNIPRTHITGAVNVSRSFNFRGGFLAAGNLTLH